MNTLYNYGIKGKLYRLIYELNRKTLLKVKTGVGLSEPAELVENITQGSVGGALYSTVNLDYSMNNHFKSSIYEVSYSHLRLHPLFFKMIFQESVSTKRLPRQEISSSHLLWNLSNWTLIQVNPAMLSLEARMM